MITINNLVVSYHKDKKVLENLNVSMDEGLIHGIVGLNGSGKTTLLNTLFGLKKPDSGTIDINGKRINKRAVSYLVTEPYFYSQITGEEYLDLFKNEAFDLGQWNRLFSLPLDQVIDGYSTGMKKKLALLGILKQDKPLMILDEPFNGLDIETGRIIRLILLKSKEKNKTIIITSHIIETLTNLCDLIHYLESGQINQTWDRSRFTEFEKEVFEKIENDHSGLINKLLDHSS